MRDVKIKRLVSAALFIALTCVATIIIQIPSPMNGYVNLGDCFVLLSGWMLGPAYGALAAGFGSALADIITGYAYYAPGTLIIKAFTALVAVLIYKAFQLRFKKYSVIFRMISGVFGECLMVIGYFGYACLILGKGLAATASIPGNIIQGILGVVVSVFVIEIFTKNRVLNRLTQC